LVRQRKIKWFDALGYYRQSVKHRNPSEDLDMSTITRLFSACVMVSLAVMTVGGMALAHDTGKDHVHNDLDKLRAMKSFEIYQFHDDFDTEVNHVPQALMSLTATALSHTPELPYGSPAEGLIVLDCIKPDCGQIRVVVREGNVNAPVVWQHDFDNYWFYTGTEFYSENRNPKKVAKTIVEALKTSYTNLDMRN